jgi:hypothetical protein
MKVSRRWIEWAHGPGAEDGQPLAMSLCDLASAPGMGAIEVADPALIAELVDVAGLYVSPCRGDALHGMGPWWMGQARRIISEGRVLASVSRRRGEVADGGWPTRMTTTVRFMLRISAPAGRCGTGYKVSRQPGSTR